MSVICEDQQGLYVQAGAVFGRPQAGQGENLRVGRHVRAAHRPNGLQNGDGKRLDAVRVRWAGQEQLWPAYASLREQRRGDPPKWAVGQVWAVHRGKYEVTVKHLREDGGFVSGRGIVYDRHGKRLDDDNRHISHMIRGPVESKQ